MSTATVTDYVDLSFGEPYRHNPLADNDAFVQAYELASLLGNALGRGGDPFRRQVYINVLKHLILLHHLVDGPVTLQGLYRDVTEPSRVAERLREGRESFVYDEDKAELLGQVERWYADFCAGTNPTLKASILDDIAAFLSFSTKEKE